jgi:hypothetical protein
VPAIDDQLAADPACHVLPLFVRRACWLINDDARVTASVLPKAITGDLTTVSAFDSSSAAGWIHLRRSGASRPSSPKLKRRFRICSSP